MRDVVGGLLQRRALLDPARLALICGNERLTWSTLNELVGKTATMIASAGIRPGDRVAVLMKNGIGFCALYHAVARLGAVLCPINWRLAPAEIDYIVGHSGATLLVHDADLSETVTSLTGQPACIPIPKSGLGAVVARFDSAPPPDRPAPGDPLLLVYTSGTTGRPKGAVLTQSQMFWASATMACTIDYHRDDVGLIPVPLFHVGGLSFATLFVHIGATAVLMPVWEPDTVLALIEREKINHFFAVAAMLEGLTASPRYPGTKLESLRWVMAGGAPVPVPLIKKLAQRDVPVIQTYGATETAGPAVVVDAASAERKAGAAGKPFFHTDVRIVDETGCEAPANTAGEIQVRAPHVFEAYWQDAAATRDAFDEDWYKSGDIGRLDEEGYLYVFDRKKDMIVSGGENIYSAEVERVLSAHPDIAEVAVIGVPDAKWGEAVCAVAVPAGDATPTLDVLQDFARAELARFKLPRVLILQDTPLPRNATGKLLKHIIRETV